MSALGACHCWRLCRLAQRLEARLAAGQPIVPPEWQPQGKLSTPADVIQALPVMPYAAARGAARDARAAAAGSTAEAAAPGEGAGGGAGGAGAAAGGARDAASGGAGDVDGSGKPPAGDAPAAPAADEQQQRDQMQQQRAEPQAPPDAAPGGSTGGGGGSGEGACPSVAPPERQPSGASGAPEEEPCAVCCEEFGEEDFIKKLPCGEGGRGDGVTGGAWCDGVTERWSAFLRLAPLACAWGMGQTQALKRWCILEPHHA